MVYGTVNLQLGTARRDQLDGNVLSVSLYNRQRRELVCLDKRDREQLQRCFDLRKRHVRRLFPLSGSRGTDERRRDRRGVFGNNLQERGPGCACYPLPGSRFADVARRFLGRSVGQYRPERAYHDGSI